MPKNVVFCPKKHLFFGKKKITDFGGTPLYGQNFQRQGGYGFGGYPPLRTKFSANRGLRIWGGTPPLPFMDKIRKVVFEVSPKKCRKIHMLMIFWYFFSLKKFADHPIEGNWSVCWIRSHSKTPRRAGGMNWSENFQNNFQRIVRLDFQVNLNENNRRFSGLLT